MLKYSATIPAISDSLLYKLSIFLFFLIISFILFIILINKRKVIQNE
jgi:hypothetical protein